MAAFPPPHPGAVLRADPLTLLWMSRYALAKAQGVPEIRISGIINGKQVIRPDTALRFARHVGTAAEFRLGMQARYDLELARERLGAPLAATVRPRAA